MPRLLPTLLRVPFLAALVSTTLLGSAQADFTLTILHTNDIHSRIEPINASEAACLPEDAAKGGCFGGTARLATAIARERAAAPLSILLDAGDEFQGSLFYTYYHGKDAVEWMNRLGYEAMAVGNHEFDDGVDVLADFVAAAHFPVLTANVDFSRAPRLAASVPASAVIEKGGQRIGLIGLTPQDTGELTIAAKSVAFADPEPAVRREVAALKARGVDKIILLSHSGYLVDQSLAARVPGLSVIVGGHSHTYLSSTDPKASGPYPTWVTGPDGHKVPIVQAYAWGKYLGRLTMTWNDAGAVTAAVGAPILLDDSIPEDPTIKARVAELAKPLEELRRKVVAETAGPIDGARGVCRSRECQMGDLVADAMLERTKGQGVSIAITNGGGLRASIPGGTVTMGDILTVLPFSNTLATFEMKGSDIVAALENGVSQVEAGAGRFPQVAGLQFDWTQLALPGVNRIRAVRVQEGDAFVPIDPDRTYLVATNNFLRTGGDGYKVFAQKAIKPYDFGPPLETVVVDYLVARGGRYQPYTDGRIRQVD